MSTQFSPTWNNSGVDFTCIKANVIDTNSGSGSTLLDLQVNGTSKFNILKSGVINSSGLTLSGDLLFTDALYDIGKSGATRPRDGFFSRNLTVGDAFKFRVDMNSALSTGVTLQKFNTLRFLNEAANAWITTSHLNINAGSYIAFGSNGGESETTVLQGNDASDMLFQRRSTNAQTFRLAETWTSSTSFGTLQFKANAGAAYQIGSAIGSAGGTNRAIDFGHWNSAGTFVAGLTLSTGGNVGIGTSSSYKLHVLNATDSSSPQVIAYLAGKNAAGNTDRGSLEIGFTNSPGTNSVYLKSADSTTSGFEIHTRSAVSTAARFVITNAGDHTISQGVSTTGSPTAFTITGAAHTTLSTAEVTDGYFNATRTVNFGATGGTIANQRTWRFTAPTFTAAAATTLTTMSTVSISGPPVASTNVTGTNAYALNVESGASKLGDTGCILDSTFSAYTWNGSALVFEARQSVTPGYMITNSYFIYNKTGDSARGSGLWISASATDPHFGWMEDGGNMLTRTRICRDADYVVALRNGTNPFGFRVYNTYTSSTSNEFISIGWNTNVAQIGTVKGSAGGSARDLEFQTAGQTRFRIVNNMTSGRVLVMDLNGNLAGSGYTLGVSGSFYGTLSGTGVLASGGNNSSCSLAGGSNFSTTSGGMLTIYGKDHASGGIFQLLGARPTSDSLTGTCEVRAVDASSSAVTNVAGGALIIAGGSSGGSNSVGGNVTIAGGIGRGTGLGGSVKIQVAPAGSTGSSANTLADALVIDSTKAATFSGAITIPAYAYNTRSITLGTNFGWAVNGGVQLWTYANGSALCAATADQMSYRGGVHVTFASNSSFPLNSDDVGFIRHTSSTVRVSDASTGYGDLIARNLTATTLVNIQNSTTPTEFNLHNTYTSATSREYLKMLAVTGGAYQIGSAIGSAGGTNRAINFGIWNAGGTFANVLTVHTNGYVGINNVSTPAYPLDVTGSIRCDGPIVMGGSNPQLNRSTVDGTLSTTVGCFEAAVALIGDYPTKVFAKFMPGEAYFGDGQTNATPLNYRFNTTGGSGTNIAGASFTIAGGKGTGTGLGGSLIFQTASAGSTGSALNSLTTRLTIDSTGAATFAGDVIANRFVMGGNTASMIYLVDSATVGFMNNGAKVFDTYGYNLRCFGNVIVGSGSGFCFTSAGVPSGSLPDICLMPEAAGVLGLRNSTNAQTFRIYSTYTSSTSFESLTFAPTTSAINIGLQVGSAGGTNTRNINFGHWDTSGTFITRFTSATSVTQAISDSTCVFRLYGHGAVATGTQIQCYKARGTDRNTKLYPVSGDIFGGLNCYGYDENAANWSTSKGAYIITASGNWTSTANGTQHTWQVTNSADATKTLTTVMTLTTDGSLNPLCGINSSKLIRQNAEVTYTPTGTTQTITLNDGNHQTLNLTSTTNDTTITFTVPTSSSAGTLILNQHGTTARDITWVVSSGSIKWMGTEPTWSSDDVGSVRIISWRWNGSIMYLAVTEVGT